MTYSKTDIFDCGGVGVTLTVAAKLPETGLRLSVADPRIDIGRLFVVRGGAGLASYRYIAAEGTGLTLTVSAPEGPVKLGSRRCGYRRFERRRRFAAPRVGRVFALRL